MIGFNNAMFWTDEANILYCEFNNDDAGAKLELSLLKSYIAAIIKLCNGKAMPFIIDLKGARGTFSIAAAKYLASNPELEKLKISESYISNTIGTKLLIGFYKRLYDPITPFGVFKDIAAAKKHSLAIKNNLYESN